MDEDEIEVLQYYNRKEDRYGQFLGIVLNGEYCKELSKLDCLFCKAKGVGFDFINKKFFCPHKDGKSPIILIKSKNAKIDKNYENKI